MDIKVLQIKLNILMSGHPHLKIPFYYLNYLL